MVTRTKRAAAVLIALFMVLGTATVFAKGTAGGTAILSTNTFVQFQNSVGVSFTTNGSNTVTNIVLEVFGATNATVQWQSNNWNSGSTNTFDFVFTNMANTNAQFRFTFGTNWANFGASSPWLITLSNHTAGGVLATGATVNVAPDAELTARIYVGIPGNAPDGAYFNMMLTNELGTQAAVYPAPRTYLYPASNGFFYGGTNWMTNFLAVRVGGPKVFLEKTFVVDSSTLTGVPAGNVVPGAWITYTLTYTNTGSAAAANVIVRDFLPTAYVAYFTNTATTAGVTLALYDATSADITANNGTVFPALAGSHVNTNVQRIDFTIANVNAGAGGSVTYRVVVK
ncbi:MAG: hypothetical protein AABZ39_14580 [Spirochaetota bacterium]